MQKKKLITTPSEERLNQILNNKRFDHIDADRKNSFVTELSDKKISLNEIAKKIEQFARQSRTKQVNKLQLAKLINIDILVDHDIIGIIHPIMMESPELQEQQERSQTEN